MPNFDDAPVTRIILREELAAFAQNLTPAFQAIETHIEAVETKLLTEIHRAEERLDAKIDSAEKRLDAKIDGVEKRLDAKIDGVEKRLDAKIDKLDSKIDGAESRLTQRIETVGVSFHKLEAEVASLTRRVEDLERFLHPRKQM